jgi:hypothetical protein
MLSVGSSEFLRCGNICSIRDYHSGDYGKYGQLASNTVQSGNNQTFRKNMPPLSSESKGKPSHKPAEAGGKQDDMVGLFPNYTVSETSRPHFPQ